jgi:glycogen debranching enzyme
MIKPEQLYNAAIETLRLNDSGGYTKPSLNLYPYQWNWDSAVIALGLSNFDMDRAKTEIRSLLKGQWRNGMVPQIIFHKVSQNYFPGPDFWQTSESPNAPEILTSGITQPPLLASMILKIHQRHPMLDFVHEVYPKLLNWHRWMHVDRDADSSGLTCLVHPWESGTDDAPRWLSVMEGIKPVNLPPYKRVDNLRVDPSQRPNQEDYDRFIYLVDIFRQRKYESKAILRDSPFLVQDVLFNSILYRADLDLRTLADNLGEPTGEIDSWLSKMKQSFQEKFWDEKRGLYFDYDLRNHRRIEVNSIFTFLPMYANLCSEQQVQRMIEEHWRNLQEYGVGQGLIYQATTLSMSEPTWEPRRYWRGPVWIIINWLLFQGFSQYGYSDIAENLRQSSLNLIMKSGFREYYDPQDGTGCGTTSFSWPAALTLEMLNHD